MYGEPKNGIVLSVQETHWALRGGQMTRFHAPPYRAENGNLGNFEAVDRNGTVFAPKQFLYEKVATGMENLKTQSLWRCNNRTGIYGPGNHPVSFTAV